MDALQGVEVNTVPSICGQRYIEDKAHDVCRANTFQPLGTRSTLTGMYQHPLTCSNTQGRLAPYSAVAQEEDLAHYAHFLVPLFCYYVFAAYLSLSPLSHADPEAREVPIGELVHLRPQPRCITVSSSANCTGLRHLDSRRPEVETLQISALEIRRTSTLPITRGKMMASSYNQTFGSKMIAFFRSLNCCGGSSADSDSDWDMKPALQISAPTNFRREDISLPGLTPEQQSFIRAKAKADAERMYMHLQPLQSSPSTTFAERPAPSLKPTFEQFTTPRAAPSPGLQHASTFSGLAGSRESAGERRGSFGGIGERVRAHGRKISEVIGSGKPAGYQGLGSGIEMTGLMEAQGGKSRKSGESWGSEGEVEKRVPPGGRI
ncbi:hypothetical protein LTR95_016162 [Oleoguttula sp. CCFEE 5521]